MPTANQTKSFALLVRVFVGAGHEPKDVFVQPADPGLYEADSPPLYSDVATRTAFYILAFFYSILFFHRNNQTTEPTRGCVAFYRTWVQQKFKFVCSL